MWKALTVGWARFIYRTVIPYKKNATGGLGAGENHFAILAEGGVLRYEVRSSDAEESDQILDITFRDRGLGDAATLRAGAAIDLTFDVLSGFPKLAFDPLARFQVFPEAQILIALLFAQTPDLNKIGNHAT
jgi:hypothetical protein